MQYSALARGTHRARTRGAEKVHAALKNGQKRDFWPFNGQFLGIETIDPPLFIGAFRSYGGCAPAGKVSTKCDRQNRNTILKL